MPLGECVYMTLTNEAPIFKQSMIAHWYSFRLQSKEAWVQYCSFAYVLPLSKIYFCQECVFSVGIRN